MRKNDDFLLILAASGLINSRLLGDVRALTFLRASAFLPGASRCKPALQCFWPRLRGLKQSGELLGVHDGDVHEPANWVVAAGPGPRQIGVAGVVRLLRPLALFGALPR